MQTHSKVIRIAWLADWEYGDSFSSKESRVVLRAMARNPTWIVMWFAIRSPAPPHLWNAVRVFPVPGDCLESDDYLPRLVNQSRPQLIVTNLDYAAYPKGFNYLNGSSVPWIRRLNPADLGCQTSASATLTLVGDATLVQNRQSAHVPFLSGLNPNGCIGADATTVLEGVLNGIRTVERALWRQAGMAEGVSELPSMTKGDQVRPRADSTETSKHIVMRQQLFCNGSWALVMFELTNALIKLGVPTVPDEEHSVFSKGYLHKEEEMYRAGAPEKYKRIMRCLEEKYDPESAVTVYFCLLKSDGQHTRCGVFPNLAGRQVLYVTGNHNVSPKQTRQLADAFEMILAPSQHVLRPYLEAGLSRHMAAVIPHGIDTLVFHPQAKPFVYSTERRFKFLQTSFPWVYEKGFDLTVRAFTRAFSSHDDVCLVLRVPKVRNEDERRRTFEKLAAIVTEEGKKSGAPEILLLESDVKLDCRGGIYTGAECYVHPLRAEGFGITILEAMACGLPVIAPAWSGPADFVSPQYSYILNHSRPFAAKSRSGEVLRYYVEPDVDHLVYLMRYVYEHSEEAKSVGSRASVVAHRGWTWEQAAWKLCSRLLLKEPVQASGIHNIEP